MAEQEGAKKNEARAARRTLTRRRLLQGGALVLGASALEYESLSGKFDHNRRLKIDGHDRFAQSLAPFLAAGTLGGPGAVLHIGHSTHWISLSGVTLLTDPWFYDPAFGALRHGVGPCADPGEIGPLDVILITHDHADHVDERAMWQFPRTAVCLVATDSLRERAKGWGYPDAHVLRPWETYSLRGVTITAVPGLHDIYEIGYVITDATKSVYFAGDSRLHPALPEIAERFNPHLSILPVDGTRLRGEDLRVMRPQDAVTAALTLKSKIVMPSHADGIIFDPFAKYVVTENIDDSAHVFAALAATGLPGVHCAVPLPGELVTL